MQRLKLQEGKLVQREEGVCGSFVVVAPDRDIVEDRPELEGVDTVTLSFPTFKDGRAFSQAKLLREAGFEGDIRATGQLFRDQLGFAVRCGFTSFDLETNEPAEELQRSIDHYGVSYQNARLARARQEAAA